MATLADFVEREGVEFTYPNSKRAYRFCRGQLENRDMKDKQWRIIPAVNVKFATQKDFEEYYEPKPMKQWVFAFASAKQPKGFWNAYPTQADAETAINQLRSAGWSCSKPVKVEVEMEVL